MNQETIATLLEEQAAHLLSLGDNIAPDFDEDTIHQFRVAVKKLRAFVRLIQTADDTVDFKLSKKFKSLYQAAGGVRDEQMHLIRAVQHTAPPLPADYTLWLAHRISLAEQDWHEVYDFKTLKKTTKNIRNIISGSISIPDLEQYFTERLNAMEAILLQTDIEDEDLHTIRKHVKDLQHTVRICETHWPKALEALKAFQWKKLETLGKKAGDYNDERNALENLEAYLDGEEKNGPREKAQAVKELWDKEKNKHRAQLLKSIQAFKKSAQAAGNS